MVGVSKHLLQRVYGTMILAASDTAEALVVLERRRRRLGVSDACPFCDVMLAVPAAILTADIGDLAAAGRHLAVAATSAARWDGTAWEAAVLEARAHLARAEGDQAAFRRLLEDACLLFTRAGQPLDAARCERASATTEPAIPG